MSLPGVPDRNRHVAERVPDRGGRFVHRDRASDDWRQGHADFGNLVSERFDEIMALSRGYGYDLIGEFAVIHGLGQIVKRTGFERIDGQVDVDRERLTLDRFLRKDTVIRENFQSA